MLAPGLSGQDAALASLEHASDRVLARRAGMGDSAAFEVLFLRHFESTYRYALHMLSGEDDLAEDATQEAWVKIWRFLPDFRGDSQVQTWLFKIVARQVLDSRRFRRPVLVDDSLLEPIALRGATGWNREPEHHLLDQELWDHLTHALVELPWRQRASWLLREFEGLSYLEIARILDTTPTVIRGQLHRARASLAIRMEQWR